MYELFEPDHKILQITIKDIKKIDTNFKHNLYTI